MLGEGLQWWPSEAIKGCPLGHGSRLPLWGARNVCTGHFPFNQTLCFLAQGSFYTFMVFKLRYGRTTNLNTPSWFSGRNWSKPKVFSLAVEMMALVVPKGPVIQQLLCVWVRGLSQPVWGYGEGYLGFGLGLRQMCLSRQYSSWPSLNVAWSKFPITQRGGWLSCLVPHWCGSRPAGSCVVAAIDKYTWTTEILWRKTGCVTALQVRERVSRPLPGQAFIVFLGTLHWGWSSFTVHRFVWGGYLL